MIKAKTIFYSLGLVLLTASTAAAQTPDGRSALTHGMLGLAVALAAAGGALGDGRAIAAACEGTARNPGAGGRIFTMLLLGMALIETLTLFTFLTLFIIP